MVFARSEVHKSPIKMYTGAEGITLPPNKVQKQHKNGHRPPNTNHNVGGHDATDNLQIFGSGATKLVRSVYCAKVASKMDFYLEIQSSVLVRNSG